MALPFRIMDKIITFLLPVYIFCQNMLIQNQSTLGCLLTSRTPHLTPHTPHLAPRTSFISQCLGRIPARCFHTLENDGNLSYHDYCEAGEQEPANEDIGTVGKIL